MKHARGHADLQMSRSSFVLPNYNFHHEAGLLPDRQQASACDLDHWPNGWTARHFKVVLGESRRLRAAIVLSSRHCSCEWLSELSVQGPWCSCDGSLARMCLTFYFVKPVLRAKSIYSDGSKENGSESVFAVKHVGCPALPRKVCMFEKSFCLNEYRIVLSYSLCFGPNVIFT